MSMISATLAAKTLDVSVPSTRTALNNLKELGIVKDVSGKGKEQLYTYSELSHCSNRARNRSPLAWRLNIKA